MNHERLEMGIDEVGRGCLAGPVVAAGVIIRNKGLASLTVADSKKLSSKTRRTLSQKIIEQSLAWSIGIASAQEIDELNIRQASLLAMRRVVQYSPVKPELALVDGKDDPGLGVSTDTIIGGDALVPVISCASIIAKVFRDDLMQAYDREYPGYGFCQHMGYGTKQHLEAIGFQGVTPIHRKSFRPIAVRIAHALTP